MLCETSFKSLLGTGDRSIIRGREFGRKRSNRRCLGFASQDPCYSGTDRSAMYEVALGCSCIYATCSSTLQVIDGHPRVLFRFRSSSEALFHRLVCIASPPRVPPTRTCSPFRIPLLGSLVLEPCKKACYQPGWQGRPQSDVTKVDPTTLVTLGGHHGLGEGGSLPSAPALLDEHSTREIGEEMSDVEHALKRIPAGRPALSWTNSSVAWTLHDEEGASDDALPCETKGTVRQFENPACARMDPGPDYLLSGFQMLLR